MPNPTEIVNVRYMVNDVQEAVDWYVGHFGFTVILASPAFGSVERGHLRLLLSAEVERLRARGVKFRNEILSGPGGSQILAEDPSGNVVELFQPAAAFQPAR